MPPEQAAGPVGGYPRIAKAPGAARLPPNMPDYEAACRGFDWAEARRLLDGLPGGGLNIAHEAVDRHAAGPRAGQEALRWIGRRGERRSFTWAGLRAATNRVANALAGLGLGAGTGSSCSPAASPSSTWPFSGR